MAAEEIAPVLEAEPLQVEVEHTHHVETPAVPAAVARPEPTGEMHAAWEEHMFSSEFRRLHDGFGRVEGEVTELRRRVDALTQDIKDALEEAEEAAESTVGVEVPHEPEAIRPAPRRKPSYGRHRRTGQ